jgi:hypothetical protein
MIFPSVTGRRLFKKNAPGEAGEVRCFVCQPGGKGRIEIFDEQRKREIIGLFLNSP